MDVEDKPNSAAMYVNPIMVEDISMDVEKRQKQQIEEPDSKGKPVLPRSETKRLRQWLRLLFYPAVKFRGRTCSFNLLYILIFILQTTKIVVVTTQTFRYGEDRRSFSSIVNRGHIVLRHLLLRDWDSTWESLPYPPSRGEFAVYDIQQMKDMINFAVSQYYNAEQDATGYYVRKDSDNMNIQLKFFDFPGFNDSDNSNGLTVSELSVPVSQGLDTNASSLQPHYTYDIIREFDYWNITEPFKRLLSVTLTFSIHSVRIFDDVLRARCLNIQGWITFLDSTNNGQVIVDLETLTSRVECESIGYRVEDADLQQASVPLGQGVIALSCISLLVTATIIILGIIACVKTKRFMIKNYKAFYRPADESEQDLPAGEYMKFFKVWDYVTIIGDCFTLPATVWIVFSNQDSTWIIETLDYYAVLLGIGCFCAWVSFLRFFKFHNKFYLLFTTLYRAMVNVLTYLVCVVILFIGFMVSGYVVMAPYHVKFQTPSWAAETLFCVVNGDEMFTTMNILEVSKTGGQWVWWFSRFYFGAYIAVFTIVVLNLLVAIFMSAYEAVREYYSHRPEDRDLRPIERAIKHFLEETNESENRESTIFRNSLYTILTDKGPQISELAELKRELGKILKVNQADKEVYVFRPRTLGAFIVEDTLTEAYKLEISCFTFYLYALPRGE